MLIRCKNCHQLFDFEKCSATCPECGTRAVNPNPVAYNAKYASEPQNPGKLLPIATIALAVAWLLILASNIFSAVRMHSVPSGDDILADVETTIVEDGEFEMWGSTVLVGPLQKMGSNYNAGMPEGRMLVRLSLSGSEADYIDEYPNSLGYLQVGEGEDAHYYAPLEPYQLSLVYSNLCNEDELFHPGDLDFYFEKEGYLYFVIPDDAEDISFYLEQATSRDYESPREFEHIWLCPLDVMESEVQ